MFRNNIAMIILGILCMLAGCGFDKTSPLEIKIQAADGDSTVRYGEIAFFKDPQKSCSDIQLKDLQDISSLAKGKTYQFDFKKGNTVFLQDLPVGSQLLL